MEDRPAYDPAQWYGYNGPMGAVMPPQPVSSFPQGGGETAENPEELPEPETDTWGPNQWIHRGSN